MKNLRSILQIFLLCLLTACANSGQSDLPVYRSIDDLKGKKVGAATGGFQEAYLDKTYPDIEVLRLDTDTDMIQALLTRRCDAVVMDDYIYYYHSQGIKGIMTIGKPLITAGVGLCFSKGQNVELREQFNEFLVKLKSDGTYDEIFDRWVHNANTAEVPAIELPKDGKPIRVAACSAMPPMVFIKNGKMVGFDVEMMTRFAAYVGRRLEWSDMNFSALIPALVSGNQDIIASGVNITPERQLSIDFSDPYFECNTVIGIREENSEGYTGSSADVEKLNFLQEIRGSIQRNIIDEDRYLLILNGLKLTAMIALLAALFGTMLGAVICWMRMSHNAALRLIANLYINIMRGMPVLVLLMIMFYVVFAGTSIDAVTVSVITFGMNFAAYVSEMFRSSIESVDKGQREAGIALGFTPVKTFYYIIMPQAFKQVLPVYKGELISLVKMTSIVGYIAVQDLTKIGDIIRSRTFDAFFPLIMVAILYFVLSWLFTVVLDFIGKKVS